MIENSDEHLWQIARKRAEFKKSVYSYIMVNIILWLIWWFTTGRVTGFKGVPWPVWVMLGWGISLARQYFAAYSGNRENLTDKEYEKLKREQRDKNQNA